MAESSSLAIPSGNTTVKVSIIDTTARITDIRTTIFLEPEHFKTFDACAYAFLITHIDGGKERRLLFDLGIRKDWTNLAPMVVTRIKSWGCGVNIDKNVSEILTDNGIDPGSIEAIIWSHAHWDHTGDPSTFPPNVDLLVGPGIKSAYAPGHPAKTAPILESDFANRTVTELSFQSATLTICGLRAIDFFNDGSFYLLDAPGHAIGHLNALARTSATTSIYLAADAYHHASQLRPNAHVHFPVPRPVSCPCHFASDAPSSRISVAPDGTSVAVSPSAANEVIGKIQAVDADENILVISAHDFSLYDVLEYFPAEANGWKSKGWKEKGRWKYLEDFGKAVKAE